MTARHFLFETVKSSRDIRVGLQVDPTGQVLVVGDLPDHELLPKVFVVDDEG